jgi:hypothetical protein
MERKKILILTFALVVLIGGLFFVARSVRDKGVLRRDEVAKNAPVAEKKFELGMFSDRKEAGRGRTADKVMGSIVAIAEKTLTVKHLQNSTILNITGSTPVMIVKGKNQPVLGQVADLAVGDAVTVFYDKSTSDANMIQLMQP